MSVSLFNLIPGPAAPATRDHGDWRMQAGCRDVDPNLFFPTGETGPYLTQAADAVAVCQACPVREACLQWAMDSGEHDGIWGGLTAKERIGLRRRTQRHARPAPGLATESPRTLRGKAQQAVERRSVAVDGGHIEWRSGPVRIDGVMHTGKQAAWVSAHGDRPEARLLRTCSHKGCVAPAHQRLESDRPPCRTRSGYRAHLEHGEEPCTPCRDANANADRNLRNTGTTKQLTPERSAA